ncbi:CAP-Gly domain-containing linker protein 1 [Papilio machaon]|uniref:CAP-Gly domain-containing linker protein 1 n=1 Tax=Papilio machaon TaxID=76193 RepID=UPI001E66417D|nr:CAP-Gly domain-containing linker protein 1 [Papilio machaon]
MDDTEKLTPQTTDHKNVLPDVVHSQQIPNMSTVENDESETALDTGQNAEGGKSQHIEDEGETESISEHVPSEIEYSVTESGDVNAGQTSDDLLNVDKGKTSDNSANVPIPHSNNSNIEDPSKLSWNVDVDNNAHISKESPVNLTMSLDSKGILTKSLSLRSDNNEQKEFKNEGSIKSDHSHQQLDDQKDEVDSPKESLCSEYLDSLNEDVSENSYSNNENSISNTSKHSEHSAQKTPRDSSESEEIIKLDIRGHGLPKFPMQAAKIIFGPPPEGSTVIESQITPIPAFQNLLSPFLVVGNEGVKVEEIYDEVGQKSQQLSPEKSPMESLSSDKTEKDVLVEEMTVENVKVKDEESPRQLKSIPVEETVSLSTMTTDYKTICEEYQEKLVYFEDAMTSRDELIAELTVSLQRSVQERDQLKRDNHHLMNELQHLQHVTAETPLSEHDTVKAQLSDFIKYQSMVKDDSTKFYSAVMSGTTSLQSSNGEKDIDREEITVNYSKSDLRSSDTDEFENGFEFKVVTLLNKFEEYIEENLRNKLRESIIQVLCDEIGKMRIDFDTEMKEMEAQLQQDKQSYSIETRRLRELLACVKAGNADIDALREELSIKHEKEMENLRTYFEKKCSDMERSYSEEVWRGRVCVSPPSGAASECADAAAGDCRRRTRSADFPSLTFESTPMEQLMKQLHKKYEQQMEEMRVENAAHVRELRDKHAERVAAMEEQINQLKAHIQTAENTEGNVSIYQQDIDLELEKDAEESRREEVRQEVVDQIQEQIKVLLSDPDAELSSWPLELVALRDRIHGDARALHDKEVPSLREEAPSAAEADKWRQRRYNSFDQNRQLEEVTKERDALQRVAASLQRCVGQLVAYCASAEDELNRTVLARLLATLLPDEQSFVEECGRVSVGGVSLDSSSSELDASAVGGGVGGGRGRHVHFAPELGGVLAALDEAGAAGFLQHQRDLSADIKRELEHSLRRLRHEAHELLDLSARLAANKRNPETRMLESSQVEIKELEDEPEEKQKSCDNCELHKKTMEEAMSECLQREGLLRADLDAAMVKIAHLMTDRAPSDDVIAEGYGTCSALERRACAGGTRSLEEASPRSQLHVLARDLDLVQRDRDDLQQQVSGPARAHSECCLKLEAANRQLRSTRQFVEEQAAEREHERDEFARRLQDVRDDNQRLLARLQTNARILAEVIHISHTYTNTFRDEFARRLQDVRDDNQRLLARLQTNARILAEVEQLEAQTREMNQVITELEAKKATSDEELKSYEEKVVLLRDIIANLENKLEQKNEREADILQQLENMKQTIEDRDSKMRALLGELESLKNEKIDQSQVVCENCNREEERYKELMDNIEEQCRWVESEVHSRTRLLQQAHEQTSACCSEPSEDVSLRDQKGQQQRQQQRQQEQVEWVSGLAAVREALRVLARAEDAALKRVADLRMQRDQLHDLAQVRLSARGRPAHAARPAARPRTGTSVCAWPTCACSATSCTTSHRYVCLRVADLRMQRDQLHDLAQYDMKVVVTAAAYCYRNNSWSGASPHQPAPARTSPHQPATRSLDM